MVVLIDVDGHLTDVEVTDNSFAVAEESVVVRLTVIASNDIDCDVSDGMAVAIKVASERVVFVYADGYPTAITHVEVSGQREVFAFTSPFLPVDPIG